MLSLPVPAPVPDLFAPVVSDLAFTFTSLKSIGISNGTITDISKASQCIRSCISEAEKIGNILDAPVKKGKRSLGSAPKLVYLSMNRYKNDINTKNLSLTPFDEGIEKTIRWFQDE